MNQKTILISTRKHDKYRCTACILFGVVRKSDKDKRIVLRETFWPNWDEGGVDRSIWTNLKDLRRVVAEAEKIYAEADVNPPKKRGKR